MTRTYARKIGWVLVEPRKDFVQVYEVAELRVKRVVMFLVFHLFRAEVV